MYILTAILAATSLFAALILDGSTLTLAIILAYYILLIKEINLCVATTPAQTRQFAKTSMQSPKH